MMYIHQPMNKSQKWKKLKELSKELNTPLRVSWRTKQTEYDAEFDRLLEYKAVRSGLVEESMERYTEEVKEARKFKKEVSNKIVTWIIKKKMKGPLVFDIERIPLSIVVAVMRDKLYDKNVLVKVNNDQYYTMSDRFLNHLLDISERDETKINTSDEEFISLIARGKTITIVSPPSSDVAERKTGAFFKYLSNSKYDLKRQQIYNRSEDLKEIKENCLLHAINLCDVDRKVVCNAKMSITTRYVPKKCIEELANIIGVDIVVREIREDVASIRIDRFGKNGTVEDKCVSVGLIDGHYFLNEETRITKYAFVNNLDEKDWNVVNDKGTRKNNRFIDTYTAVKLLIAHKETLLSTINISRELFATTFYKNIDSFGDLSVCEKDYRSIRSAEMKMCYEVEEDEEEEEEKMTRAQIREDGGSKRINKTITDKIKELEQQEKECISQGKRKKYKKIMELSDAMKLRVESSKQVKKLFFDFETVTGGDVHEPFLCHYIYEDVSRYFVGVDCGKKMLDDILVTVGPLKKNEKVVMYAHNAGYDYKFLIKYLIINKILRKGVGGLLACSGVYSNKGKSIEVNIKDSYKLISKPLRSFGKCFGLNQEKEVMPYSLQTWDNVNKRFLLLDDVLSAKEFSDEEFKKSFLANCEKWDLLMDIDDEVYVDFIGYASKYCEMDCIVLRDGFNVFDGWMIEVTGLSIVNHLTIPSLVHTFFINRGCYTGVKELSGVCRAFIQKCVVGGRVMLARNEKRVVEGKISDFDAVSLYPSAMARMGGYLKGVPKVISGHMKDYGVLRFMSGYFVKIRVTEVGIKRDFPLMSKVSDSGVRVFSNEPCELYVDKFFLEDLIKFHEIKFEIIEGYYFDQGRNNKIEEVIKELFEERIKKKKVGNPIQEIFKLLMNSAYGKALLKPIEKKDVILNSEKKLNNYVKRNFTNIECYTKIHDTDEKYIVRSYVPIVKHYNIPQVGVEILSMSKRIMNEVMCLAEDNGIKIYYQDTDSMHIDENKISELSELFREKYSRELIGKAMGQFHSDFGMSGCKDIHSIKFIGLGKKCYLDVLRGVDEKTGEVKNGLHVRMKSIPATCLKYTARKEYGGSVEAMYMDLLKGKKVSFDLLQGGGAISFGNYSNLSVGSRKEFVRSVGF